MIYIRQKIVDFATRFFVWTATLSTLIALISGLILFFGMRVEVPNDTLKDHVLESQQNHHYLSDRLDSLDMKLEKIERMNRIYTYELKQILNNKY